MKTMKPNPKFYSIAFASLKWLEIFKFFPEIDLLYPYTITEDNKLEFCFKKEEIENANNPTFEIGTQKEYRANGIGTGEFLFVDSYIKADTSKKKICVTSQSSVEVDTKDDLLTVFSVFGSGNTDPYKSLVLNGASKGKH